MNYVVAAIHEWNLDNFQKMFGNDKRFTLISDKKSLTVDYLKKINPRYIFFPHWSWIVPDEILESFECVCFHMTDLPYGRGGSPLQNLIIRGHKETKITALQMTSILDGGPIYMKHPLTLEGSAHEIFVRASAAIFEMIETIIQNEPIPQDQVGEVVEFDRRKPSESLMPKTGSLEQVYDFIRMLDAPGYPKANIAWGDYEIVFDNAKLEPGTDEVKASVLIKKRN